MTKSKKISQASSIQSLNSRVDRIMKMIPKGTFRNAGSAAGMALGGPTGAAVGRVIGTGLSAITGYGDYEVSMNSLNKVSTSVDTVPTFVRNDHSVRVTHREYVRDLNVPTNPGAFNNDAQPINPSNANLFPWLANMSRQYQQYRIHGMIVEYKTMSSDYAASGPLGTVCIATNYNVLDNKYATKIALENSEFAVSCKPSMSLIHAIECDPKVTGRDILYVRDLASQSEAPADARLYDAGLLQIATAGLPGVAGSTLGEVWISYDIEFYKPVLASYVNPDPEPTVPGFAVVSQRDGTVSATNGAMARIQYQATPKSFGTGATPFLYDATAAAPTITGDTGLNGTVCECSTEGTVKFRRNGRFVVTWTLTVNTTSTGRLLAGADELLATPSAAFSSQTSGTISTLYTVATVAHNMQATYSNLVGGVATAEVTIRGMADGQTATIACPSFTTAGTSLCTNNSCRTQITWLLLEEANVHLIE